MSKKQSISDGTGEASSKLEQRLASIEAKLNAERPSESSSANEIAALRNELRSQIKERYELYAKLTSGMFALVGALLTILGIWSRIEASKETERMERRVDAALSSMKKEFDSLAGDALKKPSLTILHHNQPIEGKLIECVGDFGEQYLEDVFLRNIGEKRTEPLSIRLFTTHRFRTERSLSSSESSEPGYLASYHLSDIRPSLAPGETWNIPKIYLEPAGYIAGTNIDCKLQVFFGGEKAVEAKFQLNFKQ